MRKIKSNFFISLDGVVEAPDKWHFPYFNDEMGAAVGGGFGTADAMLMGRVLYDEWAAYWPEHADEPFGDVMNAIEEVRRLGHAGGPRSGRTPRSSAATWPGS